MSDKLAATKACLFNIVINIHNGVRADYIQGVLDRIIDKFPCRVIWINTSSENKDSITLQVKENIANSDKSLFYDKYIINADCASSPKVPLLLWPILMPDIPIYLVWARDPTTDKVILPSLLNYARCLIFDSDTIQNFEQFNAEIQKDLCGLKCDIIDMNWARGSGWRNVLSNIFNTHFKIDELQKCNNITIQYNNVHTCGCKHNMTQALYLQAWLAAQLHWRFLNYTESCEKQVLTYDYNGHQSTVELVPVENEHFTSGALIKLISSTDEQHTFCLTRKNESPELIHIEISTNDRCELPYAILIQTMTKPFSFIQEILYNPSYEHYAHMLQVLTEECRSSQQLAANFIN